MMGELPKDQGTLFYDFCLEKFVLEDHLLRRIDQFLDFEAVVDGVWMKPYMSDALRARKKARLSIPSDRCMRAPGLVPV